MHTLKKIIYLFFLVVLISPVFVYAEVEPIVQCTCVGNNGITQVDNMTEAQCLVEDDDPNKTCTPAPAQSTPANTVVNSQNTEQSTKLGCPDDRICLENPLDTVLIPEVFGNAIKIVTGIMGSLALLVFVYGGFMWLTAAGNSEQVKKGTTAMIWATIGIIVVFSSYAIITLVLSALGAT